MKRQGWYSMPKKSLKVIKIGGKFFDLLNHNEAELAGFFAYLISQHQAQSSIVLVHGGGKQVTEMLHKLGRKSRKIDGLRVTPKEDVGLITAILAGQLNKTLVAKCQSKAIPAFGMSLLDGQIARCKQLSPQLGCVGVPVCGQSEALDELVKLNQVPIIATIGADQDGQLYNVNADHAALHIAKLLDAELILLSDVAGVLDRNLQLVPILCQGDAEELIFNQTITDGMVVKVRSAQSLANQIKRPVIIASWSNLKQGTQVENIGTKIMPNQDN